MKNVLTLLLLTVFSAVTSAPRQALAFEATLPQAASGALVAQVILKDRDSDLLIMNQELPTDSYMSSTAVAVYPSIKTEKGSWPALQPRVTRYASFEPLPLGVPVKMAGAASFYSRAGCLGCDPQMIMANGQPLNDNALTMAIPAHLVKYVGRQAKVTNPATGLSAIVKITDTGGFNHPRYNLKDGTPRVADVTIATKNAIGMKGGLGPIEWEVL